MPNAADSALHIAVITALGKLFIIFTFFHVCFCCLNKNRLISRVINSYLSPLLWVVNNNLSEKNTIEIKTLTPSTSISLAASERKIVQVTWDAPSKGTLIGLWVNTSSSNVTVTLRNAANGAANIMVSNNTTQSIEATIQAVLNYAVIT